MVDFSLGLSGCHISLISDTTVRKFSSSEEKNERLLAQIKKQQKFNELNIENIRSPKVFNVYTDKRLYYYDMEFINGKLFSEYCFTADKKSLDRLYRTIKIYLQSLTNYNVFFENIEINNIIIKKIDELIKCTNKYENILFQLKNDILRNNLVIPKSNCHGDLTLTNLIILENEIVFIDFLDSFIDSFFIDLIKLKQDLFYFWFLDRNKHTTRIEQCCLYIWGLLYNDFKKYYDSQEMKILEKLNFLRIEPYLNDQSKKSKLDCIINILCIA